MSSLHPRLLMIAALALGPWPAAARPSSHEAKERATCRTEAARLRLKLPPGACEDPRSGFRLKMLTSARELCERQQNVATGQIRCVRAIASDQ